jgi:hypothetical protein
MKSIKISLYKNRYKQDVEYIFLYIIFIDKYISITDKDEANIHTHRPIEETKCSFYSESCICGIY